MKRTRTACATPSRRSAVGPAGAVNPAVVFTAPKTVVIEDRGEIVPKEGEAVIRTGCSMISTGTELTLLEGGLPPDSVWAQITKFPETPGYCSAGTVVAAGPGAGEWVGRRVASHAWGSHARFIRAPLWSMRPIHREIPDEAAVFTTIAEIVLNGVRRSRLIFGESVVVFGLGLLGQLAVRFCREAGARPVIAVDPAPARLALLPRDPAIVPLDPRRTDVAARVSSATRGRLADVVFEVTGAANLIPAQFAALRPQGRFVVLSSPRGATTFDFHDLCNRTSVTIIGAHNSSHPETATGDNPWTGARDAEYFFDLVADGAVDVLPLITHRARGIEAPGLYRMLMKNRAKALGVVLDWSR